jgi:Ca-activated chloride channel family protein
MRPRCASVLLFTSVGVASLLAAPQFRASTELVSVYTTVQERDGRLVPDLRQEDFIVTDNGKPQPITFFSNDKMPFSIVLLLDRSASMGQHRDVVHDAASAFIAQMAPGDRARIGTIGTRILISPPEFTSSHDTLQQVLAQPSSGDASPIWLAVDQSITALYGLEGRRIILLMSDGDDQPADNHPRTPFKGLLDRIRRSGVMVYAIGFTIAETRGGRTEPIKPNEKLRELAEVGGGGYFEMQTTADLRGLFTRVADELHRQYWIGFAPPKRDGKLHEIEVKVKRPGLVARARRSYLAPSGQ